MTRLSRILVAALLGLSIGGCATSSQTKETTTTEAKPADSEAVAQARKRAINHILEGDYAAARRTLDELEAASAESDQTRAMVTVLSAPKLAFAIDGVIQGVTPKRVELAPGQHKVSFRHGLETLAERDIEAVAGKQVIVDLDLSDKVADLDRQADTISAAQTSATTSGEGKLVVLSAPVLAFSVDGVVQGVSPKEIELTAGTHTVSFHYGTRKLASVQVEVTSDKKAIVDRDLNEEIRKIEDKFEADAANSKAHRRK